MLKLGKANRLWTVSNKCHREGILPDEVTYACILKACAEIGAIDKGKNYSDVLVTMYAN